MRRLNPTRSSRTSQPLGKHSSFGRFEQTSHHLHRRTLAGSVWPHLAEDFAFGQREVQIFHGWYAPIPLCEAPKFKHGATGWSPTRVARAAVRRVQTPPPATPASNFQTPDRNSHCRISEVKPSGKQPTRALLRCFVEDPEHPLGETLTESPGVQAKKESIQKPEHHALLGLLSCKCSFASRTTPSSRVTSAERMPRPCAVRR